MIVVKHKKDMVKYFNRIQGFYKLPESVMIKCELKLKYSLIVSGMLICNTGLSCEKSIVTRGLIYVVKNLKCKYKITSLISSIISQKGNIEAHEVSASSGIVQAREGKVITKFFRSTRCIDYETLLRGEE